MRANDIIELTFNLTWNCPIKCDYCYRSRINDNRSPVVLTEENLRRECEKAVQLGISQYRFSGGEPLSIGPQLFDYADIVFDITGIKPILLTSGYLITNEWLQKARNRFSSIAISVDNPLKYDKSKKILEMIRENTSDELPLTYGVTLIEPDYFDCIYDLFSYMYGYVDKKFMPQLDYPCLGNFIQPSQTQLHDLTINTKSIVKKYGLIPYYFVYLVGSPLWIKSNIQRFVLNLHPEGNYQIYDKMEDRLEVEYRWREYILSQQEQSNLCQSCDWVSVCKHHPLWDIRYDWCELRKAIFEGMLSGLEDE